MPTRDRLAAMSMFAQVVESKSFSEAALKLGTSKSRVSRQVSGLERDLSVKLLNRSTRRLSLTDGGAIFYEHCARIVQEAELAEQNLSRTQVEPAGLVRVTCVQPFAVRHLLPALGDFHRQFPEIRVKLACGNRTLDLGEEGFDLGIRAQQSPDPNLVARRIAVNRRVVCAAPSYLKRRGTPRRLEDLARHDCVLFPPLAPKGAWLFRRDGKTVSVPVQGRIETDDMEAVRAAVVAGLGLGLLPSYVAGTDLQQGLLVPLFKRLESLPAAGVYLVYLPNRTLPLRVRTLIDFLVARFEPHPPWDGGW